MDTSPLEANPTLGREVQAVGDHSPWETFVVDCLGAFLKVPTHQRFATSYNDENLVRVGLTGYAVQHAQEVGLGHILALGLHLALASTMPALEVAT